MFSKYERSEPLPNANKAGFSSGGLAGDGSFCGTNHFFSGPRVSSAASGHKNNDLEGEKVRKSY